MSFIGDIKTTLFGLPIAEVTTTADIPDFDAAIPLLSETNNWFNLEGVNFIADKGYDVKKVYNFVRNTPIAIVLFLLIRGSKKHNLTDDGHVVCDAGIPMIKDDKEYFDGFIKQKHRCKYYK
ncbi:transposase [Thermoanaerobacterium thermosaccharolyticum]|uniref:transposase n=1 Tax=Thermoanaerobacterium thermosaccharolyticum TaxID=1517 RepID=UPI002FD9A1D2